ncbi:MAG: zinc ABC transporter substrate-binding protein [Deltaproteobacteria bacterium]|jgi:zinc transport system substrate-binding protein|nr:zinc ABC transporter substrate-binding protein [Deltaproteobacteria bacterium]
MGRIYFALTICFTLLVLLFSPANASETLGVVVSIAPQKYFVDKIGGDRVTVSVMVKPGASPAIYEPKPRQMAGLTQAKIYFAVGVPFEGVWLEKIAGANPDMRVVHTDAGIVKIPMQAHHSHEQAPAGQDQAQNADHDHQQPDPHIWLAPPLVKHQADAILETLLRVDPAHRSSYEQRHQKFLHELDELHEQLESLFAGKEDLEFMVFHPSWGYFAHTYGLRQVAIEIEGKAPKPAQLQELIEYAKRHHIQAIFVQPQFSKKSAALIAREINARLVVVDPLAENWHENLKRVALELKSAMERDN